MYKCHGRVQYCPVDRKQACSRCFVLSSLYFCSFRLFTTKTPSVRTALDRLTAESGHFSLNSARASIASTRIAQRSSSDTRHQFCHEQKTVPVCKWERRNSGRHLVLHLSHSTSLRRPDPPSSIRSRGYERSPPTRPLYPTTRCSAYSTQKPQHERTQHYTASRSRPMSSKVCSTTTMASSAAAVLRHGRSSTARTRVVRFCRLSVSPTLCRDGLTRQQLLTPSRDTQGAHVPHTRKKKETTTGQTSAAQKDRHRPVTP